MSGLLSFTTVLSEEASHLSQRLRASVVQVHGRSGSTGSGLIWREDGLIVTNSHVVRSDHIEVTLYDGRRLPVNAIQRDPASDIALLRVAASGLLVASIGDSTSLRVGQLVFAVGNPWGIPGLVTAGIISGGLIKHGRREWVQAAIELRPGNSGGPLADAHGRIIGINSMVTGPRLALAVPAHVVARFLTEVEESLRLGVRGYIVRVPGLHAATAWEDRQWGLVISEVVAGSLADKAGLLIGDVLLKVNERTVTELTLGLSATLQQGEGAALRFLVLRGGRRQEIQVTTPV